MQMLHPRDPILRGPAALPAGADDHGPEAELQPVVRVAVQGPAPFNALVLVRGTVAADAAGAEAGDTVAIRTNFVLPSFDPDRPPPFKHSSTAALRDAGGAGIDAIDHGFFDDTGRWVLLVRGESLRRHGAVELTSWVMWREEAPDEAEDRLAFRSYPVFVPPQPPRPADPWARAVARLYGHRPEARAVA